ncbi:MAG: ATP-binding cassette domain-containing protein [Vicinamibacterales bacterium]
MRARAVPASHARRSARQSPAGRRVTVVSPGAVDAVTFDHVWFSWDDLEVLREISFALPHGRLRFLLGASGSGKSTILKLTMGLLKPDAGAIHVDGARIDRMTEPELLRVRTGIGMLFQENALFDSLTVAENVGYRLDESRLPASDVDARVKDVLGFIGLSDFEDRLPAELSGGQRRRVGIARAMAARPALLLLDDPTTGLDPILSATVDDEIVKLRDLEHATIVVATHQIRDAFYVATHRAVREGAQVRVVTAAPGDAPGADFMVLRDGAIAFEGGAQELFHSGDAYLQRYLYKALPPW